MKRVLVTGTGDKRQGKKRALNVRTQKAQAACEEARSLKKQGARIDIISVVKQSATRARTKPGASSNFKLGPKSLIQSLMTNALRLLPVKITGCDGIIALVTSLIEALQETLCSRMDPWAMHRVRSCIIPADSRCTTSLPSKA